MTPFVRSCTMSDLRIGLVAKGVTDQVVIEATLKAILPHAFVLTVLQPDAIKLRIFRSP